MNMLGQVSQLLTVLESNHFAAVVLIALVALVLALRRPPPKP